VVADGVLDAGAKPVLPLSARSTSSMPKRWFYGDDGLADHAAIPLDL
jgi:hypothetical protein